MCPRSDYSYCISAGAEFEGLVVYGSSVMSGDQGMV